jgi:hypothetical protein
MGTSATRDRKLAGLRSNNPFGMVCTPSAFTHLEMSVFPHHVHELRQTILKNYDQCIRLPECRIFTGNVRSPAVFVNCTRVL